MDVNLGTANVFLGIMAVVSILEALLVIGLAIGGFIMYRRVLTLVNGIEARQVEPAMARVNAILDDVRDVSARVKEETYRVDQAINATMGRVDDSVDRMRSNVRIKTSRLVGFVRGVRVAIESMLERQEPGGSRAA